MNLSHIFPKLELMLWPDLRSHHLNNINPVSNGGVFYCLLSPQPLVSALGLGAVFCRRGLVLLWLYPRILHRSFSSLLTGNRNLHMAVLPLIRRMGHLLGPLLCSLIALSLLLRRGGRLR